jgi:hypothetical protein
MAAALSVLVMCAFVAGVLASVEAGRWIGNRRRLRHPTSVVYPTIEASVFALMGLLVSFTFYGAASRFDARRNLIVTEANAIGTAYLRIDLLPRERQPELREDFRTYLSSRLAIYEQIPNVPALNTALDHSAALQIKIWKNEVDALKESGPTERSLALSSLNEMIDITTNRTVALYTHPPLQVFIMLALSVIASAALAGYTMSASPVRDWVPTVILGLVLGVALYVIVDYEYPRAGLIRIDPVDAVLAETLHEMQ